MASRWQAVCGLFVRTAPSVAPASLAAAAGKVADVQTARIRNRSFFVVVGNMTSNEVACGWAASRLPTDCRTGVVSAIVHPPANLPPAGNVPPRAATT